MDPVVLNEISPTLPVEELMKKLHVAAGSEQEGELRELIRQGQAVARPRALCGVALITERGDDHLVIDGVRFSSRVLAVNLAETHRVFPYLATCGVEMEVWAAGLDDILQRYWSEAIREAAMRKAMDAVAGYLEASYGVKQTSRMNPGSLGDWPIEEQRPLFRLLGETESLVGVRLTDSLPMVPTKSVSGIRFGSDGGFESCLLCPRPDCPNRRSPYDPNLYGARYGRTS